MINYQKLYTLLFNASTDALYAPNFDEAKAILRQAQIDAEERYISHDETAAFMEEMLPYTQDQLDALWGNCQMTQALFEQILLICRGAWDHERAYRKCCQKYSEYRKMPE